MAETDTNALVASHVERALAAEFTRSAEAPTPVTETVAIPPSVTPPASGVAPVASTGAVTGEVVPPAPGVDERFDRMMAMMEAQTKEIAALKKGFKAMEEPKEARPTVKSLDQQVADLSQRLEKTDELRVIERDLPSVPEYATLKSLPNLSELVRTTIREEKRAARERGEGEKQVSVAQAMKAIKQKYVESLKNHLQNPDLLREIGLSAPAPATPAQTSRALTADLTQRGNATPRTESRSLDDLVRQQVERALRTLG